ncbi:MAG: DarT ssDNA thymidine ADP-ribosyltransferase family protein, partial [Pseudanabaena sp.]
EFYEDLDALPHVIDWEIMEAKYWKDTDEDGDRKRRRQAEFLVYDFLPWELINHIGVINSTIRTQVLELLQHSVHKPTVSVHRNWYY